MTEVQLTATKIPMNELLDKPASVWLLAQWMSHGINSIEKIA